MDLQPLRALVRDLNFDAHGIAVTVTPPNETAIATRAIWLGPLVEDLPTGRDINRREPRRIVALRLDEVTDVPRGTIISVIGVPAETIGGVSGNWQIDGIESTERDHHRVIVTPETC